MERFWIAKLPSKLLNAPLASLAALARSLRSPHRGEFSLFFLLVFQYLFDSRDCQHMYGFELDLHAKLAPCWPPFPTPGASWDILGVSWRDLGRLGGVLAASWRVLGRSWGVLDAYWVVLGRFRGVLEASWAPLGSSWVVLEAFLGRLGSLLNLPST